VVVVGAAVVVVRDDPDPAAEVALDPLAAPVVGVGVVVVVVVGAAAEDDASAGAVACARATTMPVAAPTESPAATRRDRAAG